MHTFWGFWHRYIFLLGPPFNYILAQSTKPLKSCYIKRSLLLTANLGLMWLNDLFKDLDSPSLPFHNSQHIITLPPYINSYRTAPGFNCKHCRREERGKKVFPLREESLSLKLPQLPSTFQHVQPRWITGREDKRMPWLPFSYQDTCPAVHCHTKTWVMTTTTTKRRDGYSVATNSICYNS